MQNLNQPPPSQPPQSSDPGSQAPMDPVTKSKIRSVLVGLVIFGILFFFGVNFLIENEHRTRQAIRGIREMFKNAINTK